MGVAESVSTSTSVPQALEPLLVRDAEALLLVDDEQAEVGEGDVPAQDAMGPDEDVDAAVLHALEDPLLLPLRHEAAEHRHLDRERGESPFERAEVLLRQDGGRDEDRHLASVLDGLEGGAQRDLGLAVAHVADDEPIHRPPAQHVGLHLLDAACLVGRLGVGEALLQLALPGRVRGEGEPDR